MCQQRAAYTTCLHPPQPSLPRPRTFYSVGMIFMPNDDKLEAASKAILEAVAKKEGLKVLGWRKVPVKGEVVGRFAKVTQPRIWQVRRCPLSSPPLIADLCKEGRLLGKPVGRCPRQFLIARAGKAGKAGRRWSSPPTTGH